MHGIIEVGNYCINLQEIQAITKPRIEAVSIPGKAHFGLVGSFSIILRERIDPLKIEVGRVSRKTRSVSHKVLWWEKNVIIEEDFDDQELENLKSLNQSEYDKVYQAWVAYVGEPDSGGIPPTK